MWDRTDRNPNAASAECGQWVTAGLHALRRGLGQPPQGKARVPAPDDLLGWRDVLEEHLMAGRLPQALDMLQGYARLNGPHVGLSMLMVATIRRLEVRWAEDTARVEDITRAFATARHLIEVWRTRQGGKEDRSGPGREPALSVRRLPLLVCVAPGDDHTFGAQILADDLTLRGWAVDTLITATPQEILTRVASRPYAALLLSVGQDGSLAGVGDLVAEARDISPNRRIRALIGGSGLAQPFAQYHFLGADSVVGTAAEGADFLAGKLALGLQDTRN